MQNTVEFQEADAFFSVRDTREAYLWVPQRIMEPHVFKGSSMRELMRLAQNVQFTGSVRSVSRAFVSTSAQVGDNPGALLTVVAQELGKCLISEC